MIGKRWKITRQCVEDAFPSITWETVANDHIEYSKRKL